jgi:predicted ATPase
MLTRLETKNYRNLNLEQGIDFGSLNIFVGPNGSGKTNLTRVLRFVHDAVVMTPEAQRGVNGFEDAVSECGSGRILDAMVQMPAVVMLRYSFQYTPVAKVLGESHVQFDLDLRVSGDNTLTIKREKLFLTQHPELDDQPDFSYEAHVPQVGIASVSEYQDGDWKDYVVDNVPTNQLTLATMWWSQTSFTPILYHCATFVGQLNMWGFYESSTMNLSAIRHAHPELGPSDSVLSPSGDNLLLVLHNLIRDEVDFEDRMTEAMRELFPKTKRLRVLPIGRVSLQMEWYLNGLKKPFYLDEMSDGTVRMLCWATVLLSPKKHKLIVIDEPEAGVHPAWLRVLAGWIREAARGSQVFISTHSSDLLDYFTEDAACVRVFKPAPDGHGNIVTGLEMDKVEEKIKEGWKLGDLYRVGDPSIGGWPW